MLKIEAQRIKSALQNALLFAAPHNDYLPAMEGVQVEYADKTLRLVATNRYIASFETVELVDEDLPGSRFALFIPTDRAKLLISTIGKDNGLAELREDGLVLLGEQQVAAGVQPETFGSFPNMAKMVAKWDDTRGEQEVIRFNPKYLALLTKVSPYDSAKTDPLVFTLAEGGGPAKVTRGTTFTAYIMPVREPA